MCQKYFSTGEFEGVDEENEDISMAIYMFTSEQETFEQAVSIRKEFNRLKSKKKVSEHILNEELYSKIDDIRKETISIMRGVTTNLAKVSAKNRMAIAVPSVMRKDVKICGKQAGNIK